MVAGVELDDLSDPTAAHAAIASVGFLVSLELRASAVTEHADVVLPVAATAEKSGSFVNWEGRVRPFGRVFTGTNQLPDVRVLAGIAEEMDRPLGFMTPEAAARRARRVPRLGRLPGSTTRRTPPGPASSPPAAHWRWPPGSR